LAVPAGTGGSSNGVSPLFPLSQTFLLHSKPGSTRTIYLDFDGHTISGTAWNDTLNNGNDIVAPPWDIDGNPSTFGTAEQTTIQRVWLRVAEDYSPFDVDVTTEYPGEAALTRANIADQVFGVRALISPIAAQTYPNAGGVAYVGVFNEIGDYHKPALIFPEMLADNEKYIAEAVTHEVGHTLDLLHQGTTAGVVYYAGHGNWAPIMGVGYYMPIVQWARGEYQDANNQEDELALITATGLNYRTADFGGSIATATALNGISSSTNGIISRTGESDFFSFQAGTGLAQITVTNWERGANAHLLLTLYNSAGIAVTNIESVDGAGGIHNILLQVPVSTDKYYVSVTGKGSGDPVTTGYSSYGSLGQYTLSITNPAGSGPMSPPPPPYGSTLAVLNGGNPNGAWQLYIQDDTVADAGTNFNGWILTLTTANPVGAVCDLAVSMAASATNVQTGNNLYYYIGVTNYGVSTASNALVAASLSSAVNWISTDTTQGSVSRSGLNMLWNVGTLATNAGARLTLSVQPAAAGTLENYAIASSTTPDPNPDDDYALVSVNVNAATPPQFGTVRVANGQFILSITSPPAPTIIQLSTNLIATNWVNVYTGTPPFWYTNRATNPASFYRGLLAP
jgi:hypothetical protein